MRDLEMGDQFLTFDVKCLFGLVQPLVYLYDMLRYFPQFVMWES